MYDPPLPRALRSRPAQLLLPGVSDGHRHMRACLRREGERGRQAGTTMEISAFYPSSDQGQEKVQSLRWLTFGGCVGTLGQASTTSTL